jgi:hypothetical protein
MVVVVVVAAAVVAYCLREKFTLMDGCACLQFTNYWRKCQNACS